MSTKSTVRTRTLDVTKPMQIYLSGEIPEVGQSNVIPRLVQAMPSGMEKREEGEKHLQEILTAQTNQNTNTNHAGIIPVPGVFEANTVNDLYELVYQANYEPPKSYIHIQPYLEAEEPPEYDMDEEDTHYFEELIANNNEFQIDELGFERMIEQFDKNSRTNLLSLVEAKSLSTQDSELTATIYSYWKEKRLRLKHSLILNVKSDRREVSNGTSSFKEDSNLHNNSNTSRSLETKTISAYIAFRRRTEKMQTRKDKKNDEMSYEKMLKLRRDLNKGMVLLEMIKRREKMKKDHLDLMANIFDCRYQIGDQDGTASLKRQNINQTGDFRSHHGSDSSMIASQLRMDSGYTSSSSQLTDTEDDDNPYFDFKRKPNCQYLRPRSQEFDDNFLFENPMEMPQKYNRIDDTEVQTSQLEFQNNEYMFSPWNVSNSRYIGPVRRVGRGGRIFIDHMSKQNSIISISKPAESGKYSNDYSTDIFSDDLCLNFRQD